MTTKRKVEIFSAGCPCCQEAVELVNSMVCSSCEVSVQDMKDPKIAKRAKELGVKSVPDVVIDGKVADCCLGHDISEEALREDGVGEPLTKSSRS